MTGLKTEKNGNVGGKTPSGGLWKAKVGDRWEGKRNLCQTAPLKFAKLYKNLTVEERDDFLFSDDCPKYRKIPKLSPGAYIFQRPFLGSLLHSRF